MTVSKLPSGRWRSQIWHQGRWVSVPSVIGGARSYSSRRAAEKAKAKAMVMLGQSRVRGTITVAQFRERWLTDPLFARPKQSTMIRYAESTAAFSKTYGHLALTRVDDQVVGEWLAGGRRNGAVSTLRTMFNDASSAKAGRLVDRNPFAGLGLDKGTGNKDVDPPSEELVWTLIRAARKLAPPTFPAWLQVAAFTGMRHGELDGLLWENVDFDTGRIRVLQQYDSNSKTFTLPKNGLTRDALITPPAREALLAIRGHDARYCFVNLRGNHWTRSARAYHWKAVAATAGYEDTTYLATRHFAGSYMTNVLELPAEDVAIALGHTDGGYLVRTLYGHRDRELALDRVARAYDTRSNVRPLRAVEDA